MKKFPLFVFILFCCLNTSAQHEKNTIDDSVYFANQMKAANSFTNINIDSVIFYANDAYLIAQKSNNTRNEIESLLLLIKSQLIKGSVSKAIKNCFIAESISKANKNIEFAADILMYEGNAFVNAGFISEGLQYLYRAKDIVGNNNYLHSEIDFYLASGAYRLGEIQLSRNYARTAIKRILAEGDSIFAVKNYLLLASTFKEKDSSQKYFRLADQILKKVNSQHKKVALLNNMALFHDNLGDLKTARNYYLEAIKISQRNKFHEDLSNLLNNYAYLMMAERNFDSAYILLSNALAIARELKNIYLESTILDSFSDYYVSIKDSTKSFKYYKESVSLLDEYKKNQQLEKSLFLSTVFETEKKEQQLISQENQLNQSRAIILGILLLLTASVSFLFIIRQKSINRKNRLKSLENEKKLEVANALIEGQDAERKRLAMDLHDNIGPRMGLLKMTIETGFRNNDNLPKVINSLDEINQEIREMSHKMLPTQLESKGLVVAIEDYINMINKSQNKSSIDFYHNLTARLNRKLEVNLFYITYELINNAIKHSDSSEIVLQLLLDKSELILSVEDNGVGFDSNKDFKGLGLSNLKQRVQYLDGIMIIDSKLGEGTEITIRIEV